MRPPRRATDPPAPDHTRKRLTPREREVAFLVADGLDDATIARQLRLSPTTVDTYVKRIRLRLQLGSRRAVAAWVNARRDPDAPTTGLRRLEIDTTG